MPELEADILTVGEVVKLDRGFPLVLADGRLYRCKHATALVKGENQRAVIGDMVVVASSERQDIAQIRDILPRRTQLVRRDPAERTVSQVMAANFDIVAIAQPIVDLNLHRLERELVLAYETGAEIAIVLTKADLAESAETVDSLLVPRDSTLTPDGKTKPDPDEQTKDSGQKQNKDQQHNDQKQQTPAPAVDTNADTFTGTIKNGYPDGYGVYTGKGRHTTVSREIVNLPGGGRVVDMPGVRGLGLWDARHGIAAAFADVETIAEQCRFRDCAHKDEPGCAVRAAVDSGVLANARVDAYLHLRDEYETNLKRREVAQRKRERRGHPRRRTGNL